MSAPRIPAQSRQLPRFSAGQVLGAGQLNAMVGEIQRQGQIVELRSVGSRGTVEQAAPDVPAGIPASEFWSFAGDTDRTRRFENPENAELFVDVAERTQITLSLPDGRRVTLQVAAP